MRLEMVRRYARGKAPFLGIPVFSLEAGKHITAVFRREHLQAACGCPSVSKASYDDSTHTLVLNGGKSFWKLRNVLANQVISRMWIADANIKWAQGQRGRAAKRDATPEQRRIMKLELEIGKLERKRDNIYLSLPVSPMKLSGFRYSQSHVPCESKWRAEKPMRRKLGWLAHRERKTWKQFYRDAEAILDRTIDSSHKHDRVCGRKHGPTVTEYLHQFPKHVGMAHKGYTRGESWEPFKEYGYGEDHELNQFQKHRKALVRYLERKRERDELQGQIDAYRIEIAESGTEAT